MDVHYELKLNINAVKIMESRYLLKDESGQVKETSSQLFRRVAHAVAAGERKFNKNADVTTLENSFIQ
jgi:ribonucleoside-diphosphate reductase alpha chain